ncbi:MAG: protein kinase [Planctomycetes bacterium]|nr:protein kinase [Planctomycetota bacterium]
MINIGHKIRTKTGYSGIVTDFIGRGGEGTTYKVKTSPGFNVLKVFHEKFDSRETEKRIKYLVDRKLGTVSSIFKAPTEFYKNKRDLGYCSSFAFGIPLDEYLEKPTGTFSDNVVMAITLAHGLCLLHERGIAHGDIHTNNFIVDNFRKVYRLYFIDLDNYHSAQAPKPRMVGNLLYIAPELRQSCKTKAKVYPNILSDLYSAGLIMHELLLMRFPEYIVRKLALDYEEDIDDIDFGDGEKSGFSENILNPELRRLLRRALSDNPSKRPYMQEWLDTLLDAFNKIHQCNECGAPFVNDSSKFRCPTCLKVLPSLKLVISGGPSIRLDRASINIGREEIGSSMVSNNHATIERTGCETYIIPQGVNGTYRWEKKKWCQLKNHEKQILKPGERLIFADIESIVVED